MPESLTAFEDAIATDMRCGPSGTFGIGSTNPPSVRSARVRMEARSEPESGSLMPTQMKSSPRAMRGRKSRLILPKVPTW